MRKRRESEAARRSQIIKAAYHVAATRGLDALTVRDVASKADISTGLVLFHFETKDRLIVALLDWLLETTTVLHVSPETLRIPSALDRFLALLHTEMDRLSSEPQRIRLFFDFWARGIRNAPIRLKMQRELTRYRAAFRAIAEEVLRDEPERFPGVTPEGLAAVAVSFIKGCAVQAMIDPRSFDIAQYLAAAHGLVSELAPSAA